MEEFLEEQIEKKLIKILTGVKNKTSKDFLKQAYEYATKNSDDNSTQTGALAVKDNTVISRGANKFSEGVQKTEKRLAKPLKYETLDHAERQCIYHAAKTGTPLEGTTMYTPWVPCSPCANAIISSGIKELVLHYDKTIKTPDYWIVNVSEAIKILIEAGMKISMYKGKIGGVENLFRGEIWYP